MPLALSPEALFQNVREKKICVSRAPEGRWGLPARLALAKAGDPHARDRSWSDVGGYVQGFGEVFDPTGFGLDPEHVLALDPVFQWTLHTVREALRSAGIDGSAANAGLVLGNLSFPSAGMARFAEQTWLLGQSKVADGPRVHPHNRFSSGLPALLTARALGLGAGGVALDAACASSLYAIKIACDRLHDRRADVMVAGAVNSADDLFIHVGFSALSALSKTGRSRPFHAEADGLVPAEGAAFVVLERLSDAIANGHPILGVIRGVGLANDGRGRGLLAPAEEGQERAMRAAYAESGLSPRDIGLLECHATGTPVGDGTEVRSSAAVFAGIGDLPVGSLKSNLGHLITAAGTAGLLKVLGAMEARVRPATLSADVQNPALAGTPLRVLAEEEPWTGPRRAAVSAFGFGGNNAHLIVEAWEGEEPEPRASSAAAPSSRRREPVAVVSVGARVARGESARDFATALFAGSGASEPREDVAVSLDGIRFPPRDLTQTLPQQLAVLEAAREAAHGIALPRDRTAVLVGMGCDPEVARYGARWRIAGWASAHANGAGAPGDAWIEDARAAFVPVLESAGVVGTMPNIIANRINSQLDLAGPSFSVSAEEASGTEALGIAARALDAGEIDAAVVGAVDLSHEPVHAAALQELGDARPPGDAAVVLVLKRLVDARRDGDEVLALLDTGRPVPGTALRLGDAEEALDLSRAFGRAHAASGLLHVAAGVLSLHHGALPREGAPAIPWLGPRTAAITTTPLSAGPASFRLRASGSPAAFFDGTAPAFHVYAGDDRAGVLSALAAGRTGGGGVARLVIAAGDEAEHLARAESARVWLSSGGPKPDGVAFADAPLGVTGELAFVFGGAAAAYPGMGRDLLLAVPSLVESLSARSSDLGAMVGWAFAGDDAPPPHPLDQLWGASFVAQIHAELTRGLLGLVPRAAIGYSSGESNALFALGAWTDLDAMVAATHQSALFRSDLTGELQAVRRVWERAGEPGKRWAAYAVGAPVAEVRAALANETRVHLTIVNTPDECVIGGEAAACARVVTSLGAARATLLGYDLAAHTPEIAEVRDAWWALHHRAVSPVPDVRFYSAGVSGAYVPTSDSAADAITAQALGTLDFPALVEQAYQDGVRVFVEHGPRGTCTRSIQRILGDRPHVAVALDREGKGAVVQIVNALCDLVAAGVAVDTAAFAQALALGARPRAPHVSPAVLRVPAHRSFPRLPALPAAPSKSSAGVMTQSMGVAPVLPSVLASYVAVQMSAPPSAPAPAAAPAPAPQAVAAPPPAPVVPPPAPQAPAPSAVPALPSQPRDPGLAPAAAAGFAGSATAEVIARLSAHRAHVARVHADYLASQAAIHEQFLALRQRTEASLLDAYRQAMLGGIAAVASAPPGWAEDAAPRAALPFAAAEAPVATTQADPPAVAPVAAAASVPAVVHAPAPVTPAAPVARAVAAPAPRTSATLPGPKYDRAQLEILASGSISSVFGPQFAGQDGYHRQVRMPEPPLLLADRVTGIDAVPQAMGTGTIWTETDVRADSWYLDRQGRMPAGIMIESGQADLLLISWLGADTLNKSDRVYRLLGCELTYHGSLPKPGDTLAYDIHVDGHAAQGPVRLFFFHYDCHIAGRPALSVRGGQAGFFTDEELADSAGVLWDPTQEKPKDGPFDPPHTVCTKRALSRAEVRAFADGSPFAGFGKGWERTQAHVRTPGITTGRMLFLDEVTTLDLSGGPWGRGYLKAETRISPDDWFFDGHFKNDPCMPGTLMFEGCLQAMAVVMTALGFTIERDGWRFEPVPEEKYLLRCRGQVTPSSKHLTYEVFLSEVVAGPVPMIFADLLCTVDGRKAFHAKRVGLRLVPDWPLSHWRELSPPREQETGETVPLQLLGGLAGYRDPEEVAVVDGFRFGYDSLIACAWGPPSEAFGPFYARFDGTRKVARLPGPPYHFMSRVTRIEGAIGGMKPGMKVEIAYDVPTASWYFDQNGHRGLSTMPFAVLLEAALQPCGWLASYVGSATTSDIDLLFRNLDGTGTLHAEILPGQILRTRVEITGISASAGMIIESFKVSCLVEDRVVYDMTTVFGFFPKEAFDDQVGLPVADDERARMSLPATSVVDLVAQPPAYCSGTLRLAEPMLLMLDRVTTIDRTGGKKGLGFLRAEKTVDVSEWFFKAHFFQDPVQPGSLGIEALIQLLQFAMLERGMGEGMKNPRFEPLMLGRPLTWKYRGQVVPKNELIQSEIEILEIGEDEKGRFAICDGFLWVDGKRIYGAKGMGMRIVEGPREPPAPSTPGDGGPRAVPVTAEAPPGAAAVDPSAGLVAEHVLDPAADTWLLDHRPTWTAPALPMMSMVDAIVAAATRATGQPVSALEGVKAHRWLPLPEAGGPVRLRTEVSPASSSAPHRRAVTLSAWREASDPALSRFEPVASAEALLGAAEAAPAPLDPLADGHVTDDPYESGALFHGPAFRYLERLRLGPNGSSAILRADGGTVPRGALHQGLLDAATHGIPHDQLGQWSPEIGDDVVGYPYRISRVTFHEALPDTGEVRVEARFAGFDGDARFPVIELSMIAEGRVRLALRLVEILLPKGPLGSAPLADRRAFLRDRRFVPHVALSSFEGGTTRLADAAVHQSDWLAGTTTSVYGLGPGRGKDPVAEIALREHVARAAFVHPSALEVDEGLTGARARIRPLRHHAVEVRREPSGDFVEVRDTAPPRQDLSRVKAYWDKRFAIGPWPVEDLYYGLIDRFVGDVVLTDPDAFARINGRSALYLGNHQVGVESLLFSILVSALSGTPTVTLAKAEHRTSWLGRLIAHSFSYPGVVDPNVITFFDRDDRESLVQIVADISNAMATTGKSAMVHVEGTRALAANRPVIKMSSVFLDMALAVRAPVVPVRFTSALPTEDLETRLEFPLGYTKQDIWIGRPITPEELEAIPYKDRKPFVIAAMNGLGPRADEERPAPPDAAFAHAVARYRAETGADAEHAVLFQTLAHLPHPGAEVQALLEGARRGELVTEPGPRGDWLADLAERLYGTHGPQVRRARLAPTFLTMFGGSRWRPQAPDLPSRRSAAPLRSPLPPEGERRFRVSDAALGSRLTAQAAHAEPTLPRSLVDATFASSGSRGPPEERPR